MDQLVTRDDVKSEIFNIGPDDKFTTINELFSILSNKMKFNQSPIYVKDRPNEVKYSLCSSNKARAILGYKTSITLEDSLDKVVNYVKENGVKKFNYDQILEINNEQAPETWKKKLI